MIFQVGDKSGVYCIESAGSARVYFVAPEATLIDAGEPGKADKILSALANIGVQPLQTVDKVVSHIPIVGWILTGKDKTLITAYFEAKGKVEDPQVKAGMDSLGLTADAIRENDLLFPVIESIHVLAICLVVGSILVVDLRLLGFAKRLPLMQPRHGAKRCARFGAPATVEGRPGASGAPVGDSTYREDLSALPDLQIIASRDLGNGSAAVCDISQPNAGGAPGVSPPSFEATEANIKTINDFACRFRDGQGLPRGVTQQDACVQFVSGDYGFVDVDSTLQFCGLVARTLAFPDGDTLVTVRLRDTNGFVGPSKQLIVRIEPFPTPPPTASPARWRRRAAPSSSRPARSPRWSRRTAC